MNLILSDASKVHGCLEEKLLFWDYHSGTNKAYIRPSHKAKGRTDGRTAIPHGGEWDLKHKRQNL